MDVESFLFLQGYEIGTNKSNYFSTILEAVISMMHDNIPNKEVRENLNEIIDLSCKKIFKRTKKYFYYETKGFLKTNIKYRTKHIKNIDVDRLIIKLARMYIQEKEKEEKDQKIYHKIKK